MYSNIIHNHLAFHIFLESIQHNCNTQSNFKHFEEKSIQHDSVHYSYSVGWFRFCQLWDVVIKMVMTDRKIQLNLVTNKI